MSAARPDPALSEQPEFMRRQYEFTRHCRDPEHNPAPGNIEDRRMAIYRDLLYNNVESFIGNNFPVLRSIIADDHWHALIRDYFSKHKASTPLFPKLPTEFLQYLEQERSKHPAHENDPPYILELAHYEWVESELAMDMREADLSNVDPAGDFLTAVPVLNPVVLALACEYPVHRIGPEFLPAEKPEQQTYLVVYRDLEYNVGFMELNPVTARLLESIKNEGQENDGLATENRVTGREHLSKIANELQHPQPQVVINGGLQVMQQMLTKDILLGTIRN